jgi:hypothetical protein
VWALWGGGGVGAGDGGGLVTALSGAVLGAALPLLGTTFADSVKHTELSVWAGGLWWL